MAKGMKTRSESPRIRDNRPSPAAMPHSLTAQERDLVRGYLKAATTDNTRRTYQSAIRQFERWGGRLPAEADTIIRYLIDRQPDVSIRTLDLHMTALRQWHEYQRLPDPTRNPLVQKTLEGMRRRHGSPKKKARPLSMDELAAMIRWLNKQEPSLIQHRNRALILTAFFGAFRRSELVSLSCENLEWHSEGVVITLPRSKTDQLGEGMERAIPRDHSILCPVTALSTWIEEAELQSGPLFRRINRWGQPGQAAMDPSSINLILKKIATEAGLGNASDFSSHSFRRGLSTSAARAGVDFELIRKQGGWKHDATVREYIDEGRALDDNAARELLKTLKSQSDEESSKKR